MSPFSLKKLDLNRFIETWGDGSSDESQGLRKCICMAYYLFHYVWDVPDSFIVLTMNTFLKSENNDRMFQDEWLKIAVFRDLGGRDLVKNGGTEDRHEFTYRFAPIRPIEAYCLFCALSQIFHSSEKPVPDILKEIYEEKDLDAAEEKIETL